MAQLYEGYRITSPYGPRKDPFTGETSFHTGIDLVKGFREPVAAFVGGTVTHAKLGVTGSGFGNFGIVVAVRDKTGALHCYAHLDSAAVVVGQVVKAGDIVGRLGSTGRSTGPHLHYEVRTVASPSFGFGTNTDPSVYLTDFIAKEAEYMLTKDDAAKLITILQREYAAAKTAAGREEAHYLANEVRKASGQKVT